MEVTENSLNKRKEFLEKTITTTEAAIHKAPEGKLKYNRRGSKIYYYCITKPHDTTGKYIAAKNTDFAAALAQKDYDKRILKAARNELRCVNSLLKNINSQKIEDVYDSLSEPRQSLVHPIAVSNREYAEKWKSMDYSRKGFSEEAPEFYTDAGIRVRSKSEILIANALEKYNVPYRYEYPLNLDGHTTIYPDFTVLNIRERKQYFWEHLGMMDNLEYIEKALFKIESYEKNGFYPGDHLILTHETNTRPLNTILINQLILRYLL